MRTNRAFLTAAAAVLAVSAACPGPVEVAEGDVAVSATLVKSTVRLGDDVVVDLKVTNRTPKPLRMQPIRLARESVSFRLEFATGGGTVIGRNYGAFVENEGELRFLAPYPSHDPAVEVLVRGQTEHGNPAAVARVETRYSDACRRRATRRSRRPR